MDRSACLINVASGWAKRVHHLPPPPLPFSHEGRHSQKSTVHGGHTFNKFTIHGGQTPKASTVHDRQTFLKHTVHIQQIHVTQPSRHPTNPGCTVGSNTFEALRQLKALCRLACLRPALACRDGNPLHAVGMSDSEMEAPWNLVDRNYDASEFFLWRARCSCTMRHVRAGRPPRPTSRTVTHGWHCDIG